MVPYWKIRRKRRKRTLSPRSLTERSAENEENVHFPHGPLLKDPQKTKKTYTFPTVPYWKRRREWALPAWCTLCGLVLITSSENYEKEGCETWSALPFWRSHCLDFFGGACRSSVIAVCRWMCHEYQKQNQLNPTLCVPSVWRARRAAAHSVF